MRSRASKEASEETLSSDYFGKRGDRGIVFPSHSDTRT